MILSNLEIQKALDEGRLVIEPEPSPRELKPGVKYCPYDTTAVDLKLHNQISIPKGGHFCLRLDETRFGIGFSRKEFYETRSYERAALSIGA